MFLNIKVPILFSGGWKVSYVWIPTISGKPPYLEIALISPKGEIKVLS